jgi:hypothetical protein
MLTVCTDAPCRTSMPAATAGDDAALPGALLATAGTGNLPPGIAALCCCCCCCCCCSWYAYWCGCCLCCTAAAASCACCSDLALMCGDGRTAAPALSAAEVLAVLLAAPAAALLLLLPLAKLLLMSGKPRSFRGIAVRCTHTVHLWANVSHT